MATMAPPAKAATIYPPPVKAAPAARPYRDFLTPSLHRRFTKAAFIGLVACWLASLPLASFSLFWSWFPLGPAGFRALFLFISTLSIFVLRVAQLHFGQRTTTSTFESFWQYTLSRNTILTCFWYLLSAFVFSELYIFSTAKSANLAWIDPGRSYERPRLNERPILLRSQYVFLALVQAAIHLYQDYDLIRLPQNTPTKSPSSQLRDSLRPIALHSLKIVSFVSLTGPFVYFAVWRSLAWSLALKIGRSLFFLPKTTRPSGLTDPMSIMFRFVCSSFVLVCLWELSSRAFAIYTAQEPTKKDKLTKKDIPLTNDAKDPYGSLISGLKAKKEVPRTMAFWELCTITQKFEERRKTLYVDVDKMGVSIERAGGSAWTQISNLCLAEIQAVSQRIQDFNGPQPPKFETRPEPLQTLPKISSREVRDENIYTTAPGPRTGLEAIERTVGSVAKHYGQSPNNGNPVSPRAQRLLEYGANRVLSKEQQEQFSRAGLTGQANGLVASVIRTPFGMPFRQLFARRVNSIIFGSPFSNATVIIYAVRAICGLAVFSLTEDKLGQVQKDIRTIIRTLIISIQNVDKFVRTLPAHWTDVDFKGDRRVEDVDALLVALRDGLNEIMTTFGDYASNLGLKRDEILLARQLSGRGPEMEIVR